MKNENFRFKSRVRTILVTLVLAFVLIKAIDFYMMNREQPKLLDEKLLVTTLSEASELTTAKINYNGVVEYSGGGIVFINKTEFLMTYTATARAGVDLSEVKVSVDNSQKEVKLLIPNATVQDVKIDPASIKYYNQKFKLLSFNDKDEAASAMVLAEESAKKEFAKMGILEFANKQAEEVVKALLMDVIDSDYTITISLSDSTSK